MALTFIKEDGSNIPLLTSSLSDFETSSNDLRSSFFMDSRQHIELERTYPKYDLSEIYFLYQGVEFKIWPRKSN